MGNEARRLEQVEEEEEETTLLLVRKSKTERNGNKVAETSNIIHGMNYKLISESEGQANWSTLTENGAHKEEPDGVFENEAENLVFFDNVQGLWKCRICSWTYQNGSVCIDHIQNHNGQFHKTMHDKILNFETEGFGHGKMEVSSQSYKASEEIESADIDLINEETEYDVETVLQKQNTHDLYCPNCNSCITGRVILRKRKRNIIQISDKRTKTENPPVQESDDQVQPHHIIGAEEDRDSGPDLFRCLSCFSFFMTTGNGFKFWKFGDKSRKVNVRDEQAPRKKSWFPSIFGPHNQDTAIEQDVPRASEPLLGTVENDDTLECEDKILLSPRHEHSTNGLAVIYGSGNEPQKITEKIDAKMEQHEIVAGYHLKEPIISNDQFEVVSGYYLKEPIISQEPLAVFAGYHLKEPIRGDEAVEVVAGYHLKEPVISKDVQVTHGSDLSVTTLKVDETEFVNEEPAQDAISVSRKGGSNLVIFSNNGSTTIEKSEEGQILIQTDQKGSTDVPPASEPLLGSVENNDTLECEDKILLSPSHEHSTNGIVVIYDSGNEPQKIMEKIDAKMEQHEIVAGYHLKEPIISNDQFEVVSGYYLKEPIISKEPLAVFPGYHLKEPIRSDEEVEVVAGYHLKEPVISKDVQVTHGSDLSVTTLVVAGTEIVNEEPAQDAISVSRKGGSNLVIFSNDGSTTIEKSEDGQILIQTAQKGSTGEDTVITIDSYPATEIIQGVVIPAETTIPTQPTTQTGIPAQERTEDVRRNSKIEVIKSIVYGGLAELITSLGVVSSAAGGDATTLNILALGMANLIGGFFVICHNLWELRCEQTDQVTSRSDRYQELLGQRQNFKLHAIVCVLSYLIFGITPIVVYGFSFQQSEEREVKLVVVGAVSLVCIIALSIGKAYVCRPPKAYVKTVVNFVILGFMASGISYAAGVLVKRFLERLGLFQSTSVSDMIFNRDSTWASY